MSLDIYDLFIAESTPEELAQLLRDATAETARYRHAFYAAKAFIDSHVADPDLTSEMADRYEEYNDARKGLWQNAKGLPSAGDDRPKHRKENR